MAFLSCNVTVYDELFDPALMMVTYNGNGSTGGDVPVDTTIYEKGQEVIVSDNIGGLVRTGHTYMDWNTAPDGSGTAYSDGDTFLIETFGLVLYAQWTINQYTLTYAAGANGSLSGTTLQTVNYGSDGTAVTAVPGTGYHFDQWSDGVMTASRTDTNVTGDITATAAFGINQYTLTYSAGANGSISGTTIQTVNYGSNGTAVTAVPGTGYHFVQWNDGVMTATRTDTNVTASMSAAASFAINQYTLSYAAGANGSLTGATLQIVNHGSAGTAVTAVPGTGYHFVQWDDGVMTASRTDTNVTGDIIVTAAFAINQYTLTYSAGANGSISGTTLQTVNYGSDGTAVTAVPGTGYHFVQWSDGVMTATRIDTNVTASMSAGAIFAINQYTLTYLAGANGSVSGTTLQTVNHGSAGTAVTAVPGTGYHFMQWDDGVMTATRTDTNVTGDITTTANFAINQYTLLYLAGANGSLIGTTIQTVNYWANGTAVTAVPDPGYTFVQWDDGPIDNPRTDINVTGDITVSASFDPETYTVTFDAQGGSAPSPGSNPVTFNTAYGALATTGKNGYIFAGWWTGPGGTGTEVTAATIVSTPSDHTLYARWLRWTRLLGAPGAGTFGQDISVDSDGNSFVTGCTSGNLDGEFRTGTQDLFVVKYNPSGIKQWTKLLGVAGADTGGYGISIDSAGNSYVTGETAGNLDGEIKTGVQDGFVVKYNTSGVKQWTRLFGVAGEYTQGSGISVDTSGNIYVGGITGGNLDGVLLTGLGDVFVIKYNASGVKQWTKLLGAAGVFTQGTDISVDSGGNSYVTGYTAGNLDGVALTGAWDVFVIKYNTSGVKQWTKLLGAPGADTFGRSISVDSGGNSYVGGYTNGNLDGVARTGTIDVFVIKYNTSGVKQWTKLLGAPGLDTYGWGIFVDSGGNSYVTGNTAGNLDGLIRTGTNDAFVIKYNMSGVKQWTKLLGAVGASTQGSGISVDSGGNSYVAGDTGGNLDGQICTGTQDLFVSTNLNQ